MLIPLVVISFQFSTFVIASTTVKQGYSEEDGCD